MESWGTLTEELRLNTNVFARFRQSMKSISPFSMPLTRPTGQEGLYCSIDRPPLIGTHEIRPLNGPPCMPVEHSPKGVNSLLKN